ncbi:S1 family peptidase [Denitrobaculum tricleocarpae]|uniref:Trypsin-like peptidase domain-containing protein n=1 Tax=Denitrobaculum tricleocarpae TaxID=2591009 RepID=A0A545TKV0_9PROT|nr:serine protease [Denitrobaculum tricleocarpae]TQV77853.1 trypsin-like peptidase domain-containing protein [Denitrobaculum tricleocarpae]
MRPTRGLFLTSALLAGMTLLAGETALAKPPADIVRAAANSVVRVMAEGCPGTKGSRAGSGFVWPEPTSIVTALHVVADCQTLTVEYVEAGVQRRAQASRSLRRADLALLTVENPPSVQALSKTATAQTQEVLAAIGLPLNVRNWQETYGSRALNVKKLSDILNDSARREIETLGAPAIELDVFRLTAVVKPGSSGGPIINAEGAVVGVVDGGLDGGASSLNWAVPAHLLQELMERGQSGANVGLGAAAESVFAFSVPETTQAEEAVNRDFFCGGRSYFHLATRSLSEIVDSMETPGTLDDPQGFAYVVTTLAQNVPENDLAALRFDLFVDSETGATIAVPESMTLSEDSGFCIASSNHGDIALIFQGQVFDPNYTNVEFVSNQFVNTLSQGLGFTNCQADLAFSQAVPHSRVDGLLARRFAALCYHAQSGEQAYNFVAHLGRMNTYLGVVAVNGEFYDTGAYANPAKTKDWAAAALAVIISTYQI